MQALMRSHPSVAAATLDSFDDLSGWSVEATEGIQAHIEPARGRAGKALCLAFDFGRVSGYALVRKRMPVSFPADFELAFDVRGEMAANALHVRFADASGDNVWWHPVPHFQPPREWERVKLKRRHVTLATWLTGIGLVCCGVAVYLDRLPTP